jgi:haloacetate dehalogenase
VIFERFSLEEIDVGEARLRVRHGGAGAPVVLLHGHPRTHTTWYAVAPILARDFTVLCPDLRGYGDSSKPPDLADHSQMSKRALAGDVISLMRALGHDRFALVGHDRGAYVAFRTAMDHAGHVSQLVVMDAVPIGDALMRADVRFASAWWHWFFFGQTVKPAERVISADPEAWYAADPELMGIENHADFLRAVHNPETVHAMLEDYRAGLTVDRAADHDDRVGGRRLQCPVLLLWATQDDLTDLYDDPVAIWRDWADDVSGMPIESGHHMAEEAPEAVAAAIRNFLRPDPSSE